jgi:hypothetical protein
MRMCAGMAQTELQSAGVPFSDEANHQVKHNQAGLHT